MTYPRYRPIILSLFLGLLMSPLAARANDAIAEYKTIVQRLRAKSL